MYIKPIVASVPFIIAALDVSAEHVLPSSDQDTCFAHKFSDRIGKHVDEINPEGNRMSQPYSIIRGNDDDVHDHGRNDIIYFIVDETQVVRRMTCQVDFQ